MWDNYLTEVGVRHVGHEPRHELLSDGTLDFREIRLNELGILRELPRHDSSASTA